LTWAVLLKPNVWDLFVVDEEDCPQEEEEEEEEEEVGGGVLDLFIME
jgi:hypothetical protein